MPKKESAKPRSGAGRMTDLGYVQVQIWLSQDEAKLLHLYWPGKPLARLLKETLGGMIAARAVGEMQRMKQ